MSPSGYRFTRCLSASHWCPNEVSARCLVLIFLQSSTVIEVNRLVEGEDQVLDKIRAKRGDYIEMFTQIFRVQAAKRTSAGQKPKKKNPSGSVYKLGIVVGEDVRLVQKIRLVCYGGSIVCFRLMYNYHLFILNSASIESFIIASDHYAILIDTCWLRFVERAIDLLWKGFI